VFAVGAFVYSQAQALPARATAVVTEYLEDLRARNYAQAYDLLCAPLKAGMSKSTYVTGERDSSHVRAYSLAQPEITGSEVIVPTQVWTDDGNTQSRQYGLIDDQQGSGLRICSGE
jgi:hypothetical protein